MTKGSDPRPHTAQLPVRFAKFFNSTEYSKNFNLKESEHEKRIKKRFKSAGDRIDA